MNLTKYLAITNALFTVLIFGLIIYGNLILFNLSCIAIFISVTVRTILTPISEKLKLCIISAFVITVILQMVFNVQVVFPSEGTLIRKLFGVIVMLLPLMVNRFIYTGRDVNLYLPSLQEMGVVSFSELMEKTRDVLEIVNKISKTTKCISVNNVLEVVQDLPRHDSFRYINNESLTKAYFEEAQKSLDDPYVYIIISNTGSAASEMLSVFTQRQYNHASLSFDRDLKTIISYNGGEKVYPPGLNHEMIEFFKKKSDASIIVYRLPCRKDQKKMILDKIEEINRVGSAYNVLGLLFKYSHRPNIMFCSQFVYKMLVISELAYFDSQNEKVCPTDFVEKDYYRKLQFDYELKFQ